MVRWLIVVAVLAVSHSNLMAQAFTFGNLALLRMGDGVSPLGDAAPISLQEYHRTGTLLNTVNIPSTGVSGLQLTGISNTEGALNITNDPARLIFTGYNPGTGGFTGSGSLNGRTSAQAPRAFGTFNMNTGSYSFGATFPVNAGTDFSPGNIRSAVTTSVGTYAVGGTNGVVLHPGTAVSTTSLNNRIIQSIGGNLYFSTNMGTQGIYQITGHPTTTGNTATPLITAAQVTGGSLGSSPFGFAFSTPNITTGTVAYIADMTAAVGVQKLTFNGTNWTFNYSFIPASGGLSDLAVDFTGANPVLFAVSPTNLWSVTDTGTGGSMNAIASAGTNFAFRGIELVAVPEPTTWALLGLGIASSGLVYWRKHRQSKALQEQCISVNCSAFTE
jgi:hypothetical protein